MHLRANARCYNVAATRTEEVVQATNRWSALTTGARVCGARGRNTGRRSNRPRCPPIASTDVRTSVKPPRARRQNSPVPRQGSLRARPARSGRQRTSSCRSDATAYPTRRSVGLCPRCPLRPWDRHASVDSARWPDSPTARRLTRSNGAAAAGSPERQSESDRDAHSRRTPRSRQSTRALQMSGATRRRPRANRPPSPQLTIPRPGPDLSKRRGVSKAVTQERNDAVEAVTVN